MASSFEAELEQIVSRFARDLAREVTRLMLRRLGLEQPAARTPGRPSRANASPPLATAHPVAKVAAAAPRATRPAAPAGGQRRRTRSSSQARSEAIEHVERTVAGSDGLSLSEIERQTALSRSTVSAALRALKDQGRLFMGGTRRFARYAKTQSAADRASLNARHAHPDPPVLRS